MKVELWTIGKTSFSYLKTGIDIYAKRISRFCDFEVVEILDASKSKDKTIIKRKEAEQVLKRLKSNDNLILLDERGKMISSIELANYLQNLRLVPKRHIFLIGGAYGFDNKLYDRAQRKISLSKMTFSHQMIRLFATEQIYRAYTIINHHPYHNE